MAEVNGLQGATGESMNRAQKRNFAASDGRSHIPPFRRFDLQHWDTRDMYGLSNKQKGRKRRQQYIQRWLTIVPMALLHKDCTVLLLFEVHFGALHKANRANLASFVSGLNVTGWFCPWCHRTNIIFIVTRLTSDSSTC